MKKLALHVPKPCHEDWEGMTQEAKGKFCGSCQKTVIDFSLMSDRQLAEFFKKPTGSVCGRFHHDQLERPIEIPRKRIPWVKYFFQFTWPAWMLFLKSCGNREATMGEMVVEKVAPNPSDTIIPLNITMGVPLPEINSTDSIKKVDEIIEIVPEHTMGIVAPPEDYIKGDTIAVQLPAKEADLPIMPEKKAMDTVIIANNYISCKKSFVAGGITVVSYKISSKDSLNKNSIVTNQPLNVFPNPARPGSHITISFKEEAQVQQLILLSMSGATIDVKKVNEKKDRVNFQLPAFLSAGTYFLQVIMQDNTTQSAKVIIVN